MLRAKCYPQLILQHIVCAQHNLLPDHQSAVIHKLKVEWSDNTFVIPQGVPCAPASEMPETFVQVGFTVISRCSRGGLHYSTGRLPNARPATVGDTRPRRFAVGVDDLEAHIDFVRTDR